jgi:peptidoglycan/xylan/chitin deacetylase (PgdA/CDA1 family)
VVTSGPRSSGALALTVDDGVNRDVCAQVGRILRARSAKGTFFVNGTHLSRRPDRWRKILKGQAVANHTFSHVDLTRASSDTIADQIRWNEVVHERLLDRPMLKIMRPPYGAYDSRVLTIAGRLGYRTTVLWNVDTLDWSPTASLSGVIARATGARAGSVILMHCNRQVTADALPAIIRHYRARGMRLIGLGALLKS